MFKLRVPNSTKRRDSSAHHAINYFFSKFLVRKDGDRLCVEFFYEAVSQLDNSRFAMNTSICKSTMVSTRLF